MSGHRYYKVVKSHDLSSLYIDNNFNCGLPVRYKVGEFVYAKPHLVKLGYGLFVFNDIQAVLKYRNPMYRVFECEVVGILDKTRIKLLNVMSITEMDFLDGSYLKPADERPDVDDNVEVVTGVKLIRNIRL